MALHSLSNPLRSCVADVLGRRAPAAVQVEGPRWAAWKRSRRIRATSCAVLATALLASCSSVVPTLYDPKPYPYLRPVHKQGRWYWQGDGRCVEIGLTTAGLEAVVAKVPEAAKRAEQYQGHLVRQLVWTLVYLTGTIPATIGTVKMIDPDDNGWGAPALQLTGGVLMGVGLWLANHHQTAAVAAQSDATQMFNDHVWEKYVGRRGGMTSARLPMPATPACTPDQAAKR